MKRFLTATLFLLALAVVPSSAFTMDLQAGVVNHASEITTFNLNIYGHLWYRIDQMLFVGVGIGTALTRCCLLVSAVAIKK